MDTRQYDRAQQDLGNIVHLEHVNVCQPNQALATLFYLVGLGLTRDPYLMVGLDNMWINIGRSQVHLPTAAPQVLRGRVGLVLPDLAAAKHRLERVAQPLAGTAFAYSEHSDFIDVTCPWGNRFRLHAPAPEFGPTTLALAYVEFDVPAGAADGIARFYREVLGAPSSVPAGDARAVTVVAGASQRLIFRETAAAIAPYDGHHIQIYIVDFSGPHEKLRARGLITEESNAHQYRFQHLVDPANGQKLFEIEHEVRSLRHPLRARELVNRNAHQSNVDYAPNCDRYAGLY
jgi:hypothetical protein